VVICGDGARLMLSHLANANSTAPISNYPNPPSLIAAN